MPQVCDWSTFNATFHCSVWDLKFLPESVPYSFLYTWLNLVFSRSIMQHKTQKSSLAEAGRHPWRSSSPTSCSNRIAKAMIGYWRLCPVGFWLSLKIEIPQTPKLVYLHFSQAIPMADNPQRKQSYTEFLLFHLCPLHLDVGGLCP